MDDAGISLVSNTSTEFANNFLFRTEICNNWIETCYIIVDGIRRTKIMRALA